jgi:hypothetical protein
LGKNGLEDEDDDENEEEGGEPLAIIKRRNP